MTTWAERIAAAREHGAFTPEDRGLAASWNTCAVGEAVGLPETETEALQRARKYGFYSNDNDLGLMFIRAVSHNDFDAAEMVLQQIHDIVAAKTEAARG